MKKFSIIMAFAIAVLSGNLFLTSCNGGETVAPTVAFIPDQTSATKNWGDLIQFTVKLTADEKAEISKIVVTRALGSAAGNELKRQENINQNTFDYSFYDTIPAGVTSVKYTFTAYDNKDKSTSKDFTVTVNVPTSYGPINSRTSIILGNQWNNSIGQFFSFESGVLDIAQAKLNAAKIDLIFGHRSSANGGAYVGAPNSADAKAVYDNAGTDKLSTWTVLNATNVKPISMAGTDFDKIQNDSAILANTGSAGFTNSVKPINPGNVFAFVTVGGKKGLARVVKVSGSQDTQQPGTLEFDFKIQQ